MPEGIKPGQSLRNEGSWIQQQARSWLKAMLFHSDLSQAGQFQNGIRLDGAMHLFKLTFFILQGLVLGWIALGGRRAQQERMPDDETWQKLMQLQSAEKVAFEIFAKYGQGGLGELAPRSELQGGWRIRLQSLLGWAQTRDNGSTVYYLPEGLLQKSNTPMRALLLRLILEYQVSRVYAQNRPDLELADMKLFGENLRIRLQRVWSGQSDPQRNLERILAGGSSPLARALAAGERTKVGKAFADWAQKPGTLAWEWMSPALDVIIQGTVQEQADSLSTLSGICEKMPGMESRRMGSWNELDQVQIGSGVFLPRMPESEKYRGLYRTLLGLAERVPSITLDHRGVHPPLRPRTMQDAA